MYTVYQIARKNSSDAYIGCTSNIKERIETHRSHAFKGSRMHLPLYAAIRKYGLDAFEVRMVEKFDDRAAALAEEARCIKLLQPSYNTYGR